MAVKETNKISYALRNVQTKKSVINTPIIAFDLNKLEIDFNIDSSIGYNIQSELLIVALNIDAKIKQTSEIVIQESTHFFYSIKDLKEFLIVNTETKEIKFKEKENEILPTTLLGISFSTMRGILIEKSKGTIVQGQMLPIINPSEFFKPSK